MKPMSNVLSLYKNETNLVRIEVPPSELPTLDAICITCNKRFKSLRAVSMHLRITGMRHAVNFINYGNYDKKTGLRSSTKNETS
jgi:hypothetical protein